MTPPLGTPARRQTTIEAQATITFDGARVQLELRQPGNRASASPRVLSLTVTAATEAEAVSEFERVRDEIAAAIGGMQP